jgi:hypothetical protein
MQRSSDGEINQGSGGEAASDGLDLGERLSAQHGNFPGTQQLATTLALARKMAEFGANRLPLLAKLQRHWLRGVTPPGWFAPVYAWPISFMDQAAPGGLPSSAVHGLGVSRSRWAGATSVTTTNLPGAAASLDERRESSAISRVSSPGISQKTTGVSAAPRGHENSTGAVVPRLSRQRLTRPARVEQFNGPGDSLAHRREAAPTLEPLAAEPHKRQAQPGGFVPHVRVGSAIVRRGIGSPVAPERTSGTERISPTLRPQHPTATLREVSNSATNYNQPADTRPVPEIAARIDLASSSWNERSTEPISPALQTEPPPATLRANPNPATKANRPADTRPVPATAGRMDLASTLWNERSLAASGVPLEVAPPGIQLGAAIVKRHIGIPKSRLDAGAQSLNRSVVSGPASAGPMIQATSAQDRPGEPVIERQSSTVGAGSNDTRHQSTSSGSRDTEMSTRAEPIETHLVARSSLVSADQSRADSVGAVPPGPAPNAEPVRPEGPVEQAESSPPDLLRGGELGSAIFRRHSGTPQESSGDPTLTAPTFVAGPIEPSATPSTGGVAGEESVPVTDGQEPPGSPVVLVHRKAESEASAPSGEASPVDGPQESRQQNHEPGSTSLPVVRVDASPAPELLLRATTRGEVSPGVLRTDIQSPPSKLETAGQTHVMLSTRDAETSSPLAKGGGWRPVVSTEPARLGDRTNASVSHIERTPAEPDGGVARIQRSPVALAGTEPGSGQMNGGTEGSSAAPLMLGAQSPPREDAISRTPNMAAQALPAQMAQEPHSAAPGREPVPALPLPGVLTHLDKPGKFDPAMEGTPPTVAMGSSQDFTHNFAPELIRRHQAVPIMRPVEYRDLRSNSAPAGSFVQRAPMTVTPAALGQSGSIKAPAHRQNSVVSSESRTFSGVHSTSAIAVPMGVNTLVEAVTTDQQGPADSIARQFDDDSPSITVGETLSSGAPLGADQPPIVVHPHLDVMNPAMAAHDAATEPATRHRDQAHGETPIQPDTRSAGPGPSTIFRTADAGRERFVVAAANAGSGFSAGFVQRVTASLERTPAVASFPGGSRLDAARAGHVPGVFPVALNRIPGATPGSSVARFATDKLSAVGSGGAWPALLQSRSTSQASSLGRQGEVSSGFAHPVFRPFKAGGLAGGGGSNGGLMVNRLPNVTGVPGFPGGSTTGFQSMPGPAPGVSPVPLRHIGASGSPIHALQRQGQGASAPAPSAVTTNASPAIPPPAAPRQNAAPDVKRLAEQVYRMIVQRLATERDRRGL